VDHCAGGFDRARGSVGAEIGHRRGCALCQSRLSGRDDRQASFSAGTVLIARATTPRPATSLGKLLPLFTALAFGTASPAVASNAKAVDSPSFSTVPELAKGFRLLYMQKFSDARGTFQTWEAAHPDQPFGKVALAASYLFEELYRQNVLSSDFF